MRPVTSGLVGGTKCQLLRCDPNSYCEMETGRAIPRPLQADGSRLVGCRACSWQMSEIDLGDIIDSGLPLTSTHRVAA